LIPKVNNSPILKLVPEARTLENDPGSSQGSGVAYEGPPGGGQGEQKEAPPHPIPELRVVGELEKAGMTGVVLEFHEQKKENEPHAGLSVRYQAPSGGAKGLLLNRKAE
jgi:hypothetical protein